MAGNVQASPSGVQDATGARATAVISPNGRVRTTTGFVGTVFDTLLFGGPSVTGVWFMGDQRVRAGGAPTVSQSSMGLTVVASSPPSQLTMMVVQGDSRVRSM
jgi:hypothetical protein